MAYRIYNKFPIDLQPRKVVGFSLPFNGPAVFNPTYTTRDQIKSNLINYFLTNKGERIFNPFFGADLKRKLFEQSTDINAILLQKQIDDDIKVFFPLVNINELSVINTPDTHTLNININYTVVNFGINDSIKLSIQ